MSALWAVPNARPCGQYVLYQLLRMDGQRVQLADAQDEISRRPCIRQSDPLDFGRADAARRNCMRNDAHSIINRPPKPA